MNSATSTVSTELNRTRRRTPAPTAADVRRAIAAFAPPPPAGINTMAHDKGEVGGGAFDLWGLPSPDRHLPFFFHEGCPR
jgi:hypothetical protein